MFNRRTIKSKHIEYMNIAAKILLLVEVITQPIPGTHLAFTWTPVVLSDIIAVTTK